MTTKLPKVSELTLRGYKPTELEELVTKIEVNYSTDTVAELSVSIIDPGQELTKAATAAIGSTLTFAGKGWQVGSVEARLGVAGTELAFRARDPLAKRLRKTYKTSAEKKVSPSSWVSARVKAAGGRATVQPSSKRATIAQSKNQSVLDVINDLASELEWNWTSYAGTLIFGSRFYAWQGRFNKLSDWAVTWAKGDDTDAISLAWSDSDDNADNRAELDCELAYDYGVQLRPWHRLKVTAPGASGFWLVEDVQITHDGVTPVQIRATRPKPPSPKAGSSSKES